MGHLNGSSQSIVSSVAVLTLHSLLLGKSRLKFIWELSLALEQIEPSVNNRFLARFADSKTISKSLKLCNSTSTSHSHSHSAALFSIPVTMLKR